MNSQLQYLLNHEGYKSTPSRQLVFAILNTSSAISIKELRQRLHGQIPDSSLYRALDAFRKIGILNDVVIAGVRKVELTGEFRPHHHHVSCKSCGSAIEIRDDKLELYLKQLATKNNYVHLGHSFEITGLCSKCLTK